jgi:hypothetical protein
MNKQECKNQVHVNEYINELSDETLDRDVSASAFSGGGGKPYQ